MNKYTFHDLVGAIHWAQFQLLLQGYSPTEIENFTTDWPERVINEWGIEQVTSQLWMKNIDKKLSKVVERE